MIEPASVTSATSARSITNATRATNASNASGFEHSLARRAHLHTPVRAHRMIPEPLAAAAHSRVSIRVDVPDRLLRMTRFGLDFVSDPGSGWWRRVEVEMQALVDAHLPNGASEVQMSLDIDRLEVVLSYQRAPAGGSRPMRCA